MARLYRILRIGGVSLVGCLGFRFAETTTTNNSYDEYIKAASISTDQNNMITNYENAIDLDPTREEGYMDLLKKVYLADDEFSQEEAGKMTQILGSKRSGNRSNESFLESNEKAYAEFAFQLGLAYYYYYGDGGKQMSQTWFDIAYESDQLKDNQSKRAEILGKIAGYWSSLNKSDRAGDATTSDAVYWKDMTELIDGNLVEMDNAKTALVMYQEVVYQISTNTLNFKTAGVTQAEMESQLDKIESRLQTDFVGYVNIQNESDNEIEGMIATISGEIDNARRQVRSHFHHWQMGAAEQREVRNNGRNPTTYQPVPYGIYYLSVLTILFAALSIFLFFFLRIRNVFDNMTGRAEKRTIRMMEEENAKTESSGRIIWQRIQAAACIRLRAVISRRSYILPRTRMTVLR